MKVRVLVPVTGCINGQQWPKVGETIVVPDGSVDGMIAAGHLEQVAEAPKVEKRPAVNKGAESRKISK